MKILPNLILSKKHYAFALTSSSTYMKMKNHTGCKNNTLALETISNDVKNYAQFCTIFGLTQILKSPTRITCSTTSLIDHVQGSVPE